MARKPRPGASGAHRRREYGAVGSTNDLALEAAAAGEPGPLWITADRQLQGRGRQGRRWISEPGNLYASLLLTPAARPAATAQLSLVAAVALTDAMAQVSGPAFGGRLAIKWPNDVLLDKRKVAGILSEARPVDGRQVVVIGFGVNCAHAPALSDYPTTSLAAAGTPVAPDALWAQLAAAMADRLAMWDGGAGFAAIRAAWLARAPGLGQPMSVRLAGQTVRGQFAGIDNDGRLVLNGPAGEVTITAGDVISPDPDNTGRGE